MFLSLRKRITIGLRYLFYRASLLAQTVKNLPAMQETQVPSLGQEDPLEKGMATRVSMGGKGLFEPILVGILWILLRVLPVPLPPLHANVLFPGACTHTH